MSRRALAPVIVSCVALLAAPRAVDAFCGFYVGSGDTKLFDDATQVVMFREGTRTVLAMQNDYRGPVESFALVVPVPVVLHDGDVKTLPRDVFDHVDKMGAPRLVEYWEQDPCALDHSEGDVATVAKPSAHGALNGRGAGAGDYGVTVEAQFVVGEYEVVILSAKESTGLDAYLRDNHYKIPDGAEPLLRPYVESGMKFFVAKVDPAKVKFENGRAALSPLRFYYDSDEFTLPIRLGLANSSGTQDLIVSILAPHQRYEVANYGNVFIPTNLDVADGVRDHFAAFYAALFDDTASKNPGAVVTEYAWQATSCDPCPGPSLRPDELMLLGGDVMTGSGSGAGSGSAADTTPHEAKLTTGTPTGDLGALTSEEVERVLRARYGLYRACYQKELNRSPKLAGKVVVQLAIDGSTGQVTSSSASGLGNANVETCIARNVKSLRFPVKGGSMKVSFPIELALGPAIPTGRYGRYYPNLDLVLTRLHVRYGKDITNDLTFRKADAVVGGRESYEGGKLEQGAMPSRMNTFQARYAIRHEWTGPIACEHPRRGLWGGPPSGGGGRQAIAAQQTAFAPRGQLQLASAIVTHDLGSAASAAPAAPSHERFDEPYPAGQGPPKSSGGGCGCETGGGGGGALGMLAILGAMAVTARGRTRSLRARRGAAARRR